MLPQKRFHISQTLLHAIQLLCLEEYKPMRTPRIHFHHRLGPTHPPLRAHKDRIIQQGILGPHGKQRGGQLLPETAQVLVEGRDGRIAPVGFGGVRQVGVDVVVHDVLVDDEGARKVVHEGGEAGEVVAAEDEVEAVEAEAGPGGEEVEGGQGGEVGAGRLFVWCVRLERGGEGRRERRGIGAREERRRGVGVREKLPRRP